MGYFFATGIGRGHDSAVDANPRGRIPAEVSVASTFPQGAAQYEGPRNSDGQKEGQGTHVVRQLLDLPMHGRKNLICVLSRCDDMERYVFIRGKFHVRQTMRRRYFC